LSSTPCASVVINMFGTYNRYIIYRERRASKLFSSILDRPWANRHCPSPTRFARPIFKYIRSPSSGAGQTSVVRPSLSSSLLSMLYIFYIIIVHYTTYQRPIPVCTGGFKLLLCSLDMIDDVFSHWHPIRIITPILAIQIGTHK